MTTSTALAATITGTLLTLAPITPQNIRDARQTIDPATTGEQDPQVAADLAVIQRNTDWMRHWQLFGTAELERRARQTESAEDRILAAYGYPVPTDAQRYRTRQARRAVEAAIEAAADRTHPAAGCVRCRGWEDCPDADRAYRNAVHAAWFDRWNSLA